MTSTDRPSSENLDQLVEGFTRQGMTRRQFMQRAMAAGLSASAAGALLAACGSKASGTSGSNSGKTLHVLAAHNNSYPTQQAQWFQQISSEFKKATGATLAWDTWSSSSEEQTKLQTSIVSGSGPDVFVLGSTFNPTAQATGGFHVLSSSDWQAVGGESRFFKQQLTMSGSSPDKLIAVPFVMRPFAMVYNTDMFKKAGISSPPTTWTDYVDAAKKMTDSSAGVYGTTLSPSDSFDPWKIWWHFTKQLGGAYLSKDMKTAQLNSPQVVQAVQFWFDWAVKYHIVDPNSMSWKATEAHAAFANGKAAMLIMIDPSIRPSLDSGVVKGKYAFAPMPTVPYGMSQMPSGGVPVETIVSGDYYGITTYSQVKDLALKFINLVTEKQHQIQYTQTFGDLPTNVSAANQLASQSAQTKAFVQAESGATPTPFSGAWGAIEVALAGVSSKLANEVATNSYSPSHVKPLLDAANATIQSQLH